MCIGYVETMNSYGRDLNVHGIWCLRWVSAASAAKTLEDVCISDPFMLKYFQTTLSFLVTGDFQVDLLRISSNMWRRHAWETTHTRICERKESNHGWNNHALKNTTHKVANDQGDSVPHMTGVLRNESGRCRPLGNPHVGEGGWMWMQWKSISKGEQRTRGLF